MKRKTHRAIARAVGKALELPSLQIRMLEKACLEPDKRPDVVAYVMRRSRIR